MEMRKCLSISILTVIAVVDARSVSVVEISDDGFKPVPVRSFEMPPHIYGPMQQYESGVITNNDNGFNRGQGHAHTHNHRTPHAEHSRQQIEASVQLTENSHISAQEPTVTNVGLQNGNRRYEIGTIQGGDSERRGSDFKSLNGGLNQRQQADCNNTRRPGEEFDYQHRDVQSDSGVNTHENDNFTPKVPVKVFNETSENHKTIDNQYFENADNSHATLNLNTDSMNINNRAEEERNPQDSGNIKQTLTTFSNNDNKPKIISLNKISLINQNINSKGNNDNSVTNRSMSTEKSIPTTSDEDNFGLHQSKVTQDNEVTPKTDLEGRMIPSSNPQNQDEEGDRWIWMDAGGNGTKVTTVSSTTIDLNDRAAFDGDKCPNGKVRFGNKCVEEQ